MAHDERYTELRDISELSQFSVSALRCRAVGLAVQPTETARLCQVLKELRSRQATFDWVDGTTGDTLFHSLARTPGHDWGALREIFAEILPRRWLRRSPTRLPSETEEKPGNLLDQFDDWLSKKVHTVAKTVRSALDVQPFKLRNMAEQTVISTALMHRNLPCAQIAWDYQGELLATVKYAYTQDATQRAGYESMHAWLRAFLHHAPDPFQEAGYESMHAWLRAFLHHAPDPLGKNTMEVVAYFFKNRV